MKTETFFLSNSFKKETVSKGCFYRGGDQHLRGFEGKQAPNAFQKTVQRPSGLHGNNASWVTAAVMLKVRTHLREKQLVQVPAQLCGNHPSPVPGDIYQGDFTAPVPLASPSFSLLSYPLNEGLEFHCSPKFSLLKKKKKGLQCRVILPVKICPHQHLRQANPREPEFPARSRQRGVGRPVGSGGPGWSLMLRWDAASLFLSFPPILRFLSLVSCLG